MDQPASQQAWGYSMPLSASSSFGHLPDAELPLSAVDTDCQFPANGQSFPESAAELNSIPIPYGITNYESLSGSAQALPAGDAEPHFHSRQNFRRCVKCWAIRKPAILFILQRLN